MQFNKVYRRAILLFWISILFFLGCEKNLLTEIESQGPEDMSILSLDKRGPNSIIPIALARADNPRDFVPDFLGDIVTVQGVITSPNSTPQVGIRHYIQDNSAAMRIFAWASISPPVLKMGDEVVVTGVIKQFAGNTFIELQSTSDLQIVGTGKLRNPKKIHTAHLDDQVGEKLEGELVVLEKVRVVSGQFDGLGNVRIVDSKGDTAKVFIDRDYDIVGSATPSGLFNLTGNVSQYTFDMPADHYYEIVPRGLFDIE